MNFFHAVNASVSAPVAPSDIVTSGLIHRWKPSNVSGTTILDLVGSDDLNCYNGMETSINLPWFDVDGVNDFAGAGTNYTPSDMKFQWNDAFTICGWMRVGFTDTQSVFPVFLASMNLASPYPGFRIAAGAAGTRTRLAFALRRDAFTDTETLFLNTSMTIGNAYYYCIRYSGVRGGLSVYLNGVNASGTYSVIGSGYTAIPYTKEMFLGDTSSSGNNVWRGSIGDVHVYNRELTTTEITDNFNATKGTYGL